MGDIVKTIKDILRNKSRIEIFDRVLNEACRQWCDLMEEAPERKDGEGFSDFFYEIFAEKEDEYIRDAKRDRKKGNRSLER